MSCANVLLMKRNVRTIFVQYWIGALCKICSHIGLSSQILWAYIVHFLIQVPINACILTYEKYFYNFNVFNIRLTKLIVIYQVNLGELRNFKGVPKILRHVWSGKDKGFSVSQP